MKNLNKKILISIFVFFIILLLSISIILADNVLNYQTFIDEEKIYYEIKYLDSNIINMANLLNNIENKESFYINWKKLSEQSYCIHNYWNSVILDLNYLDIDKKDLTDFSKILDELIVSIKQQDKSNTLKNLIELYNKLTIYVEKIENKNYKEICIINYNLLCAYNILETVNWTQAHEYILIASKHIYNLVNSIEVNQYSQYNINQAYVSIKELENLINVKDMDVFYFKYNIAINNLMNLTL